MKKFTVETYPQYAKEAVCGIAYDTAVVYNAERETARKMYGFDQLAARFPWYNLPGDAIMEYGKHGRVLRFGDRAKKYALTHLSPNTDRGSLATVDVKDPKIGTYVYVDPAMIAKVEKFLIGTESPKNVQIRVVIEGGHYYASVPFEYFDDEN